jgi:hypothetical protein
MRVPCRRSRAGRRRLLERLDAQRAAHARRALELDVAVADDLEAVAPRVAEVEALRAAAQHVEPLPPHGLARGVDVVDDEAKVAVVVRRLGATLRQRDELIAHVDERHPRHASAKLELEDPPVEGQRFVHVFDLERDVVDADQACLVVHGPTVADRRRRPSGAGRTAAAADEGTPPRGAKAQRCSPRAPA